MRMDIPPLGERRAIDRNLAGFFREVRPSLFQRALTRLCRYYSLKRPRVEWYEYLDWGKTAGKTFEDGRICLVHPDNWKRGRVYNSERLWVQTVYHELGHYLLWADPERKADAFAYRMIRGLRAPARRDGRAPGRRKGRAESSGMSVRTRSAAGKHAR